MTILPEHVVNFCNVNIQRAELLIFKAGVSFLVLEYQVEIQLGKTTQFPISTYCLHKYSTFSTYLILCTGALYSILLQIYAVDPKKNSYKTNLAENIPVVFMNLNTNRQIAAKHNLVILFSKMTARPHFGPLDSNIFSFF